MVGMFGGVKLGGGGKLVMGEDCRIRMPCGSSTPGITMFLVSV